MELKEIKELIALMKKNDLSVFKMEQDGFKITLKKGTEFQPVITTAHSYVPTQEAPVLQAAPALQAGAAVSAGPAQKEIVSPMVGTFYSASSPESPTLVSIGSQVDTDTVVCIIEAMKVMNEVKSEVSGVITEILVENGKPVQFGQPLFKVK